MSRFKELNRINNGIKNKNKEELLWALEYCNLRLSISHMKEHKKHWSQLIKIIVETLNEIK